MALWPNGRHMTRSTYKGFGTAPGGAAYIKGLGDRMNRFVGASFARTASTPDGYDVEGYVPAIKAGAMSARPTAVSGDFTGNALAGGPMTGTGTVCTLTGTSGLSMIVSMSGTATVCTLSGNNLVLKLTIGLSGTAEWTLTGTSSLSMVVPIEGTGNVFSFSGTSDLRGRLSLSGEWTPFTELSPENLAAAVWDTIAADFNTVGTMGNKLNTASSGGVDLNALAQAVWEYIDRTLTSGGPGYTPEQVADAILLAAQATPIHSDVQKVRSQALTGDGSDANPWNPA